MIWWKLWRLKASKPETRKRAAEDLSGLLKPQVFQALATACNDDNEQVRQVAHQSLEAINSRLKSVGVNKAASFLSKVVENADNHARAAAVLPLIQTLKDSRPFSDARPIVARLLGQIGYQRAIPPLIEAFDGSHKTKETIADALAEFGGKAAVDALTQKLSDIGVHSYIAKTLIKLGPEAVSSSLILKLADKESWARESALNILQSLKPDWSQSDQARAALTGLIERCTSVDYFQRKAATEVLDKIDPAWVKSDKALAIVPALINLLEKEDLIRDRELLLRLGPAAVTSAVETLSERLRDPRSGERSTATRSLGLLRDVKTVGPLVDALKDSDSHVRQCAAYALGNVGDVSALAPLRKHLQIEQDSYVYSAVVSALEKLGWTSPKPTNKSLWALKDFPGVGKTVTCSTNCSRVGVVRSLGDPERGFDAEYAVVDGRPYPKARRITPNAQIPIVQFSGDGMLWGYSAADDEGNEFAVINGSESHHYTALVHPSFLFDLSLSEVGGHYAFGARREKTAFYVIDGDETDPADDVDDFRWTTDGSRCLFTEKRGDVKRLVVDGSFGPSYADILLPWFSEDGSVFTYKASIENKIVAVGDHIEIGEPCDDIDSLTCGPVTFGVCYWAKNSELAELRVGGKPSGATIRVMRSDYSTNNWQIEFSSDGQHIAAAATSRYGEHTIFQDNHFLGQFGHIGNLAYDSSNRLLFIAGPSYNESYLHIDGKPTSDNWGCAEFLHVAPKCGRYCFQTFHGDESFLVVDGQRSKLTYSGNADFRLLKFSPAGKHVSYVANRGPHEYIAADDFECGPFEMVVGTFFVDEDVLIGIVLREGAIERLEWQLDHSE